MPYKFDRQIYVMVSDCLRLMQNINLIDVFYHDLRFLESEFFILTHALIGLYDTAYLSATTSDSTRSNYNQT